MNPKWPPPRQTNRRRPPKFASPVKPTTSVNSPTTRRNPPSRRGPRLPAPPSTPNERSMRIIRFFTILAVFAAAAEAQAPPGPQQNPPPPQVAVPKQNASAAQQPTAAGTLKTNTRLITVDVVATDSHGNVMRGLKPEDFQVSEEHAGQQKIVQFSFVDASANSSPAPPGSRGP